MTTTTRHNDHVGPPPPQPARHPYTGADEEGGRPMTRPREALARADRIQIALLAGLFALLAAILGAGAVAYTSLSGQLLAIDHNTHEEIVRLGTEVRGEIAGLRMEMRGEIAGLRTEMRGEIAGLRTEMQRLADRVARIETRVALIETRVARIETMIEIHHGALPGS